MTPEDFGVGRVGAMPTVWNCLSQCSDFGLGAESAARLIEDMRQAMRSWRDRFSAWGVDHATVRRLEPAFARVD